MMWREEGEDHGGKAEFVCAWLYAGWGGEEWQVCGSFSRALVWWRTAGKDTLGQREGEWPAHSLKHIYIYLRVCGDDEWVHFSSLFPYISNTQTLRDEAQGGAGHSWNHCCSGRQTSCFSRCDAHRYDAATPKQDKNTNTWTDRPYLMLHIDSLLSAQTLKLWPVNCLIMILCKDSAHQLPVKLQEKVCMCNYVVMKGLRALKSS